MVEGIGLLERPPLRREGKKGGFGRLKGERGFLSFWAGGVALEVLEGTLPGTPFYFQGEVRGKPPFLALNRAYLLEGGAEPRLELRSRAKLLSWDLRYSDEGSPFLTGLLGLESGLLPFVFFGEGALSLAERELPKGTPLYVRGTLKERRGEGKDWTLEGLLEEVHVLKPFKRKGEEAPRGDGGEEDLFFPDPEDLF